MESTEANRARRAPAEQTHGDRVVRLRHVVHGGAWHDHARVRDAARGVPRGPGAGMAGAGAAGAAAGAGAAGGDVAAAGRARAAGTAARVRALAAALGPLEQLSCEAERVAVLHEWAVVADPEACATATVRVALVAGTVAAAVAAGRDDLRPLLRELEAGRLACRCVATEAGWDDEVAQLATTATHDPVADGFLLRLPPAVAERLAGGGAAAGGHAAAAGGAAAAAVGERLARGGAAAGEEGVAIVFARLVASGAERGVAPFLVPLGAGASAPTELRLPFEALLLGPRSPAVLTRDGRLQGGPPPRGRRLAGGASVEIARLATAAAAAAALRASATVALRRPPASAAGAAALAARGRQRALTGVLADAYATTALVNAAKLAWEDDRDSDRARRQRQRLDVTKALATAAARAGVATCRERCGADPGGRLAAFGRFLDDAAAADGDGVELLGRTAAELLTGDGYEALAPVPRPLGELDLRDPAWWTWVARTAERHSHARAVVRMRDALRRRPDDGAAVWEEVLPEALDVARRHGARLTVEALVDDAERLGDGSEAQMALLRLGALWYVREVDRDAAYLAGHAIVATETMALLPDLVDHLVDLLVPALPLLLDAFALDDELLGLPSGAGGRPRLVAAAPVG